MPRDLMEGQRAFLRGDLIERSFDELNLRSTRSITPYHVCTEFRIFLDALRRARMVRVDPPMFRREAKCHRHVEIFESGHLPVEPIHGVFAIAIRPTKARAEVFDPKVF